MQIEWRNPANIPFFQVSEKGDVRITDTGKIARIMDNGRGYKQVQIMREGKRHTMYVHRLVAECFVNNPDGFTEVNHKDGNKGNNSAENLEWCSHGENMKHAYKNGLHRRTTPKQQEAARKSIVKCRDACKEGWLRWSKTEEARQVWIRNLKGKGAYHE